MRGLPVCATSCGRIVTVWFGSPSAHADSSDSQQFSMACVDEFHASDLVEAYGKMIADSERVAELELKVKVLSDALISHYGATV
jgi:hypothetical protein